MKQKLLIIVSSVLLLSACGTTTPTSLYYWGGTQNGTSAYENLAYLDYKKQTPEAMCRLICLYEEMVTHPGGSRQVPPPGICAEYGYLLLNPDTYTVFSEHATDSQKKLFQSSNYGTLFTERGKEMFEKEMEYYPESATFIMPLLKKLSK